MHRDVHVEARTFHTIINRFARTWDQRCTKSSLSWTDLNYLYKWQAWVFQNSESLPLPLRISYDMVSETVLLLMDCCYLQIFTWSSSPANTFLYLTLTLQSATVLNIRRGLYQREYHNRDSSQVILDPPPFWFFSEVKCYFKGCSLNDLWFVLSNKLYMTEIHRNDLLLLFFCLQIKCKAQHLLMGLPEG